MISVPNLLIEYFKWNRIIGTVVISIICAYYIVRNEYQNFKKACQEDYALETPNPNFVPPATAKRFEIKLSHEPYLDSIQAYSMDDLGCCIERYEHIYSDGNTVYLPFQARKARAICVQYAYRKGDLLFPIYEIIRR